MTEFIGERKGKGNRGGQACHWAVGQGNMLPQQQEATGSVPIQ